MSHSERARAEGERERETGKTECIPLCQAQCVTSLSLANSVWSLEATVVLSLSSESANHAKVAGATAAPVDCRKRHSFSYTTSRSRTLLTPCSLLLPFTTSSADRVCMCLPQTPAAAVEGDLAATAAAAAEPVTERDRRLGYLASPASDSSLTCLGLHPLFLLSLSTRLSLTSVAGTKRNHWLSACDLIVRLWLSV